MVGYASGAMTVDTGFTTTSKGLTDGFIVQFTSEGVTSWVLTIGGSGNDALNGVAYDSSSNIYVTGYVSGTVTVGSTTLTSNGAQDVVIAKLSNAGSVVWIR